MNNKAEALRNLSAPAFEVPNVPAQSNLCRGCAEVSLPEALLALL